MLARRFGAPLLLVFLLLGLMLGVDGPGGIRYADTRFTYLVGSLSLAIILFDGGLRTRAVHVRGSVAPAVLLASVGVLVTAGLTAFAATKLLDLPPLQGLLLGTIVASTDAAAVFFLLRAGGLHLERRTGATLEIESGSNDPVAVFLTVALTTWINGEQEGGIPAIALHMLWAGTAGLALGYLGGRLIVAALNKYDLPSGLHPWLALAGALTLFAITNLIEGSGYLAVYLAGIVVANRPLRARNQVMSLQDAVTWFAQLVMFLLLGLLAAPHALWPILWPALGVAAFLMLVARPAAVLLCLLPFRYRAAEITFISWTGLRGAVGIFLASIPLLAGLPNAWLYFNVAFVVVLVSLLVQGWTLARAAHWLGVAVPRADPDTRRIQLDLPGQLEYDMIGYRIAPGSAALRGVQLPGRVRLAMVVRAGKVLLPDECDAFAAHDYAYFVAPGGQAPRLDWLFADGSDAREAEQDTFGSFILPGDVPLGELAKFYGLPMPARIARATAAQLFDERFDAQPQVGDRLVIARAVLVAREVRDDRVTRIGLKFTGVGERLISG
ncbi:potassium/proton antiporter [Luteimonas sp. 50]|uniref:Potassium/proton antiporter n=1 Tax=Cognatiluteimonas sedimenti TaxID=2927791 RepID=A0ABT0A5C6_9GAMM|nr:potassium/proton antiporter [Lysobacter sedimenti]